MIQVMEVILKRHAAGEPRSIAEVNVERGGLVLLTRKGNVEVLCESGMIYIQSAFLGLCLLDASMAVETTVVAENGVAMWDRVIQLNQDLSLSAARALLKVQFSSDDQERMRALSAKARAGTLSEAEQIDIDTYERLGCLLDILHSKARRALKHRRVGK